MIIPRAEHPRPQFERENWVNLNGEWNFAFDFSVSGKERQWYLHPEFSQKIQVPFCPESKLSGIGFTDFMNAVWYSRKFSIKKKQLDGRVLLHFGAVDYLCEVWINGKSVGTHKGGYASFSFDITDFVACGENTIVVYALDMPRENPQPRGKQSAPFYSQGCSYTRTTGIWQTVWLEFVPKTYIQSVHLTTDSTNGTVTARLRVAGETMRYQLRLAASFDEAEAASCTVGVDGEYTTVQLRIEDPKLWNIGEPNLYTITYELVRDGQILDSVKGYFGIRSLEWRDGALRINGRPVFQRLVLDQGFYPDGICTAPTDDALRRDIALSMELGFNGARMHQKVFEERYLYHADRMGYLVWGEYGSWGMDVSSAGAISDFLPEWLEVVDRDYSHPCIITWCPFNETWDYEGRQQDDGLLRVAYHATKSADSTRPVIDTSGSYHVITDMYDIHDYEQDVSLYQKRYRAVAEGDYYDTHPKRQRYGGQPYLVSEYGGAWWAPGRQGGWGYGEQPKSEQEVAERYEGLTTALLECKNVCGFCYTQLTDVEQEQNGLYTYGRERKFSDEIYEIIRRTNLKKAAIE